MIYTEITISVPVGYEDQIKQLVVNRIEGIVSHELTQLTAAKKLEISTEMEKVYTANKIVQVKEKTIKV